MWLFCDERTLSVPRHKKATQMPTQEATEMLRRAWKPQTAVRHKRKPSWGFPHLAM
jgi:hypothetical protein